MASAVITSEWVREERRKQNAVVFAVILACLLVAFFPRNERRLFTWPELNGLAATIGAPVQTRLRAGIFGPALPWGPGQAKPRQGHDESVNYFKPEDNEPMLGPFGSDALPFADNPLTPGFDLPSLGFLPGEDVSPLLGPGGHIPGLPPSIFGGTPPGGGGGGGPPPPPIGSVPEIGTWAMMIFGIGAIGSIMRTVRRRVQRRRAHRRWREGLLPKPICDVPTLRAAPLSTRPAAR